MACRVLKLHPKPFAGIQITVEPQIICQKKSRVCPNTYKQFIFFSRSPTLPGIQEFRI